MIAIGVALWPTQGSLAFDPRQLFARGEAGGWYDPGDASSIFADAARTVPAAIDGTVGGLADQSGRGHHLTQAVPGARPVLRRDAAGRRYLDFDGIDDRLVSPAAGLRIIGPVTLGAAVQRAVGGRYDIWMSAQTQAGLVNQYELRTEPAGAAEFVAADASAVEVDLAGAAAVVPVGATRVVTAMRTGAAIEFNVGGTATSASHMMVPTADASSEFWLGGRRSGDIFARGRVYGAVVVGRVLSAVELGGLRAWLAARGGG